jgi:hypothetical protein
MRWDVSCMKDCVKERVTLLSNVFMYMLYLSVIKYVMFCQQRTTSLVYTISDSYSTS